MGDVVEEFLPPHVSRLIGGHREGALPHPNERQLSRPLLYYGTWRNVKY
jgi:hypothetical protein